MSIYGKLYILMKLTKVKIKQNIYDRTDTDTYHKHISSLVKNSCYFFRMTSSNLFF